MQIGYLYNVLFSRLINNRVNIIKTLLLNFYYFPLKDALKFPILCYGAIRIRHLGGKILIRDIKKGALKIGYNLAGYRTRRTTTLSLLKDSKFVIDCCAILCQGSSVVVGEGATLLLGNRAMLGDGAEIICKHSVEVGAFSDITWDCQVTDYGSHAIIDMNTNMVGNIYRKVVIGDYCWIGNRTTVQPGTRIPSHTIVGSNSLLNKDYIGQGIPEYSMIAGMPAKLIKKNIKRDYKNDAYWRCFFGEKPETPFHLGSDIFLEV